MSWLLRVGKSERALPYVSHIRVWPDGGFYLKFTDDVAEAASFEDWGEAFYLSGCVPMALVVVKRS